MRHQRFIARLVNRPQMITPAAAAAVVGALMPGSRLDGYDGPAEIIDRDPREYRVGSGMAVIPIVGELVHRGSGMDALSGVASYQNLGDMISDALGDSNVSGILLDIDSPGGEAAGCLDFANWLYAQRGTKPIWASVNQQAASAAYAIASAADRILVGQDGRAGSVGVVFCHTDISRALDKNGITVTFIYAGEHKIEGAAALPLSQAAKENLQAEVDGLNDRFCEMVGRNRGLSTDAVKALQAAQFTGVAAISAGLADELATYEESLSMFQQKIAPVGALMTAAAIGARMAAPKPADDPAPTPKPVAEPDPAPVVEPGPAPDHVGDGEPGANPIDTPPARQPTPPASPGYLPAEPLAAAKACAAAGFPQMTVAVLSAGLSMADIQARLKAATDITEIGKRTGQAAAAVVAIDENMSVEGFRKMAFGLSADKGPRVDTARRSGDELAPPKTKVVAADVYARAEAAAAESQKKGLARTH